MQVPRWRNFMILKNSLIPSTCTATRLASFHSTPSSFEKRKDKWNFLARTSKHSRRITNQMLLQDVKSSEQPSKNFIRYATRHKRADAKKALKNLLFNSGYCPKVSYQHVQAEDASGSSPKNHRSNSYRHAQKSHHKKMKRKLKRESFSDDENHPETIFQATYGKRWYTWSFNAQRNSFQDSSYGFEWREPSSWKDTKKSWENISDIESEDEECTIGSSSDRKILGLPSTGPLKTEDVKKAFHLSALKWHPDKHQGSSQEMAAEKFRHCVNAYNSLCNALSSA